MNATPGPGFEDGIRFGLQLASQAIVYTSRKGGSLADAHAEVLRIMTQYPDPFEGQS